MDDKKIRVTVDIFGETYALKGSVEPEEAKRIAQLVDSQMRRAAKADARVTPGKAAVLAALNIAEEYLRLERDYRQMMELLKNRK